MHNARNNVAEKLLQSKNMDTRATLNHVGSYYSMSREIDLRENGL